MRDIYYSTACTVRLNVLYIMVNGPTAQSVMSMLTPSMHMMKRSDCRMLLRQALLINEPVKWKKLI